jgi:hypothetical protein
MPSVETPDELFEYYKTMIPVKPNCSDEKEQEKYRFKLIDMIEKDLKRSDPGNDEWKIPYEGGKNHLYNVLIAMANHDPEIGYAQGMNVVVSWILKFTRSVSGEVD